MKPDNEWLDHLNDLKAFMQQEITAMREILAIMHQQQQMILRKDQSLLQQIEQECSFLLSKLSDCRSKRVSIAKQLKSAINLADEAPLEELFQNEVDESCETLLLWDQLKALKEKIDLQKHENDTLAKEVINNPNYISPPQEEVKKKTKVATFHKKR